MRPHYLARLAALQFEPGTIHEVKVMHDDSCPVLTRNAPGTECDCDADIELVPRVTVGPAKPKAAGR